MLEPLFPTPTEASTAGRTEQAVEAALAAVEGRDPRFAAVEALALSVAHAIDAAAGRGDESVVWHCAPRLLDILRELRLTPATLLTETAADDAFDELMEWVQSGCESDEDG